MGTGAPRVAQEKVSQRLVDHASVCSVSSHLKRACLERQGKGGGRMETLFCGVLRTPPSDRNTSVARVTATKLASHPSEAAGGESGFGLACCRAGRALTTQKTPAKLEICFPACSSAFIAARQSGSRNRTLSYPRCRSLTCAIEQSPAQPQSSVLLTCRVCGQYTLRAGGSCEAEACRGRRRQPLGAQPTCSLSCLST